MNQQLLYYTYGLLIYIPTAAVISFLYGKFSNKKSTRSAKRARQAEKKELEGKTNPPQTKKNKPAPAPAKPNKSQDANEDSKPKPKKLRKKVIPEGKIAYCKYCEAYLLNDEFFYTHSEGKKHLKHFEGREGVWYKFVDPSEANKAAEAKKYQPKTITKDEEDDGWTQILRQGRNKK